MAVSDHDDPATDPDVGADDAGSTAQARVEALLAIVSSGRYGVLPTAVLRSLDLAIGLLAAAWLIALVGLAFRMHPDAYDLVATIVAGLLGVAGLVWPRMVARRTPSVIDDPDIVTAAADAPPAGQTD